MPVHKMQKGSVQEKCCACGYQNVELVILTSAFHLFFDNFVHILNIHLMCAILLVHEIMSCMSNILLQTK